MDKSKNSKESVVLTIAFFSTAFILMLIMQGIFWTGSKVPTGDFNCPVTMTGRVRYLSPERHHLDNVIFLWGWLLGFSGFLLNFHSKVFKLPPGDWNRPMWLSKLNRKRK